MHRGTATTVMTPPLLVLALAGCGAGGNDPSGSSTGASSSAGADTAPASSTAASDPTASPTSQDDQEQRWDQALDKSTCPQPAPKVTSALAWGQTAKISHGGTVTWVKSDPNGIAVDGRTARTRIGGWRGTVPSSAPGERLKVGFVDTQGRLCDAPTMALASMTGGPMESSAFASVPDGQSAEKMTMVVTDEQQRTVLAAWRTGGGRSHVPEDRCTGAKADLKGARTVPFGKPVTVSSGDRLSLGKPTVKPPERDGGDHDAAVRARATYRSVAELTSPKGSVTRFDPRNISLVDADGRTCARGDDSLDRLGLMSFEGEPDKKDIDLYLPPKMPADGVRLVVRPESGQPVVFQ